MNFTKSVTTVFLLSILFSVVSFAQDKDMMKDDMNKKEMMGKEMMKDDMMHSDMMNIAKDMDGIAIKGYDAVSLYEGSEPEMGMMKYSYKWMDAEWQFTSEEHLMMFEKNPAMYAPQFGGYCAYAVGLNKLVPADPAFRTIENGKVYLNVNGDAEKLFRKDLSNNIMKAENNWKSLGMVHDEMMNDKMDMN